jgi:hypothetical protein
MEFPGNAPGLNVVTSWPELNGMGWYWKKASVCSPPFTAGGEDEAVDGSVDAVSNLEFGRDFFSIGGC